MKKKPPTGLRFRKTMSQTMSCGFPSKSTVKGIPRWFSSKRSGPIPTPRTAFTRLNQSPLKNLEGSWEKKVAIPASLSPAEAPPSVDGRFLFESSWNTPPKRFWKDLCSPGPLARIALPSVPEGSRNPHTLKEGNPLNADPLIAAANAFPILSGELEIPRCRLTSHWKRFLIRLAVPWAKNSNLDALFNLTARLSHFCRQISRWSFSRNARMERELKDRTIRGRRARNKGRYPPIPNFLTRPASFPKPPPTMAA